MKRAEELLQSAWAYALYDAWCRFGETPLYAEVAAEFGDVLSVEHRAVVAS